jgi:tetratricopeptide (TPR) repeat protein
LERSTLAPRKLPDPKRQLKDLLGDSQGGRAWRDLNAAAEHLDQGRAGQARHITERLYRQVPQVLEVAELHGLALYGQGRWRQAIEVLEEVRELSGLPDQNPVLADAHRAVGNYADVEVLWKEISEASPASAVVVEGRIVAAGALADQGKLQDAVRLLSKGWKRPKRPLDHHLRRAYALADLYERAGERPKARELFGWIAHHDSRYLDVKQRSS